LKAKTRGYGDNQGENNNEPAVMQH